MELTQIPTELVRERDHDQAPRDGAASAQEVTHGASHLGLARARPDSGTSPLILEVAIALRLRVLGPSSPPMPQLLTRHGKVVCC